MQETTYRDAEQLKTSPRVLYEAKTSKEVQEKNGGDAFVELRERGHELSRRIALDDSYH